MRIRSRAIDTVVATRSRSAAREYQVSWAAVSRGTPCRTRSSASISAGRACVQRRLQRRPAVPHGLLVGQVGLQRQRGLDQVVGEQPRPGVADLGLDDRGLARHLGLPAERLELAADLGDQVGEPVEVALARLELAERLLLALAVLEDAGRLLDEAAADLRGGLQDRVELALADDDVHLPADAGVAEQVLDVEQPGRLRS